MTNRVERELVRLYERLDEKYEFTAMKKLYNSGSINELTSVLQSVDIQNALSFWFNVRIRTLDPTHRTITKNITSNMIMNEICNDLGITVPQLIIADIMSHIISKDDIVRSYDTEMGYDTKFLFNNVELIELSELATPKIFIAQPMSGVPDEEVEKIREKVTELMKNKYGDNIEIIDQFHVPEEEMAKEPLERPGIHLLGRSIQFLADADLVVFVGDFLHAKGCCVELAVCKEYDIPFEVYSISDVDKPLAETDKRDNSNDWLW